MSEEKRAEESEFGMVAEYRPAWNYEDDGSGWSVHLPHQCDAWKIAGDDFSGVSHAEAVAALERFIAEANVVLEGLRAAAPLPEGTQP